jgi:hypothetical protein
MRTIVLLGCFLLGSASAQVIVDVPLGSAPPPFVGPTFADATSVSVATLAGGGAIHTHSGLPHNPAHSVLALAGPAAMTAAWVRLDDHSAAYDAPGGTVALVHGLPGAPQALATTFPGPAGDLFPVNGRTAVKASPSGFHVLRHDALGFSSVFIASPEALILDAGFASGAAGPGTAIALGVGPDGMPHTSDDRLVRLDGLADAALTTVAVSTIALAQTWTPEGFIVVPSGAAVLWINSGIGTFDLSIVQVVGPAVAFIPMSITVPGPFGYWQGGPWYRSAEGIAPNGVLLRHDDDNGFGKVLIGGLDGTPALVESWYDDPINAYTSSQVLSDRDIVFVDNVTLTGFSYGRHTNGVTEHYSNAEPVNWAGIGWFTPNARVIAAYAHVWSATTIGGFDATLTIERQHGGGQSTVSFDEPDASWIGNRVFPMGPGRVGGFLHLSSPASGAADRLRICSFAAASAHELYGKRFAPAAVSLAFQPSAPAVSAPLTMQVSVSGGPVAAALVGVSTARIDPLNLAPPHDAILHLDSTSVISIATVPLFGGVGSLTVPGGLPPALVGLPLFFQALASWDGRVELSDLGLVILDP